MHRYFVAALAALVCLAGCSTGGFRSAKGFVPDEATAVAIAEAVLVPIYGKGQIEDEKPFQAKLVEGVWHVEGSLPEGWHGGVAAIKIAQADARVLHVIHGQ